MAGNYADVPGSRMAYDRDGTIGFDMQSGSVIQVSSGFLQYANAEAILSWPSGAVTSFTGSQQVGLIFPELRDIVGYYIQLQSNNNTSVTNLEVSANTTSGLDGTWTTLAASPTYTYNGGNLQDYRTSITSVSSSGKNAIRFSINQITGTWNTYTIQRFHVYGSIASGQNPNRLRIWHPTLDQEVTGAYFDWGNAQRNSSADRTFRVKNNSSSLTANSITLSFNSLTDTSPTVVGQHLLQKDSAPGFASTVSITSLAPGEISENITVRRVTPSNAVLALWATRLLAEATSWT